VFINFETRGAFLGTQQFSETVHYSETNPFVEMLHSVCYKERKASLVPAMSRN
jgi:hypothetical protein